MNLKAVLICYIFISAINLSKTTKIQEVIPNYPFPSLLENYYNLFASQSGLPVLEKLDSQKLEVFKGVEKFVNKIIDKGNELTELLPETRNLKPETRGNIIVSDAMNVLRRELSDWP